MKHSQIATALAIAVAATSIGGCNMLGDRKFWYPQGPAGSVNQPTQAEAEAQQRPAGDARGRQLEVSPHLIAQSPPPPRGTLPADASLGTGYTQATRYGDLLFVSGQIGMDLRTNAFNDRANVEQQTRQAMENIRAILEAHRLTMANVVSVTVYMKSLNDFRAMNDAYETFFRSTLPARSVVEVARLPRDAAVEIAVIAGR